MTYKLNGVDEYIHQYSNLSSQSFGLAPLMNANHSFLIPFLYHVHDVGTVIIEKLICL